MKILLVDDDNSMREVMTRFLAEDDHTVRTAENGRVALNKIEESLPDLVLSDIKMPEMNGIDLLENASRRYNVPFVMITGYADTSTAMRALRAGAWYFMLKPINFFELKTILDRVDSYRRLESELNREKSRSLDLYSLEDLSGMIGRVMRELSDAENIQADLEALGRALNDLRKDCAATDEMRFQAFRSRLDGSLGCLADMAVKLEKDVQNLEKGTSGLDLLCRGLRDIRLEEVVLSAALEDAMLLVHCAGAGRVLIEVDEDISVLADRDSLVLLLARIMRILLGENRGVPANALEVSARRLDKEILLKVVGSLDRCKEGPSEYSGTRDVDRVVSRFREAFDIEVSMGAAAAMGGSLSLGRPADGCVEYRLSLLPATERKSVGKKTASEISGRCA